MIRDFMKEVTKKSVDWLGKTLGLPGPVQKGLEKVTGSLFTKSGAGGEFKIIDTSMASPNFTKFGMRTSTPGGSSKARGYAETVNPETLRASWDSRLAEYYTKTYRVKRTTTLKA